MKRRWTIERGEGKGENEEEVRQGRGMKGMEKGGLGRKTGKQGDRERRRGRGNEGEGEKTRVKERQTRREGGRESENKEATHRQI